MMRVEGFDDCIVGIAHITNRPPLYAYDKMKIIMKMIDIGWAVDLESAISAYDANIGDSWVGENTPVFIHVMAPTEALEELGGFDPNQTELFDEH